MRVAITLLFSLLFCASVYADATITMSSTGRSVDVTISDNLSISAFNLRFNRGIIKSAQYTGTGDKTIAYFGRNFMVYGYNDDVIPDGAVAHLELLGFGDKTITVDTASVVPATYDATITGCTVSSTVAVPHRAGRLTPNGLAGKTRIKTHAPWGVEI